MGDALLKQKITSDKNLFKWFRIVILVWLLPSVLLWTGLYLFIAENCDRKDNNTLNKIESDMENFAYYSSRERFFQKRFSDLFEDLKGRPCNPVSNLQKLLDKISKQYPKGMIDIYLFNGNGEILPTKDARDEFNEFLKLATMEFNDNAITDEQTKRIGLVIPNSTLILKKIRDQKNRALELGNPDKYSLCYFNSESVSQQSVGGILIFVHYKFLKNEVIFNATIPNGKKNNFGYIDSDGSHLPKVLDNSEINENFIYDYYKYNPTNRFRRYSKLVCVKRLRENCWLVGAENISHPSWLLFGVSAVIFFVASGFFFNLTYKTFVTKTLKGLNTRQRIIWLFAVCYIMPFIVGIIVASQYLMELKNSLKLEEERKNYQRLAEIDSGFSRFITSKLIEYRKRNEELSKYVNEPEIIVNKLKQLCSDYTIDNAHLISSESKILLSSSLVSAEVRRHKDKTKAEQDEVFDTWIGRHAIITPLHIKNLYDGNSYNIFPTDDKDRTEPHKAFVKVFANTAANAMDYYNQSKNISTTFKKKNSNLVVGAMVESHSMKLFETAKSNISNFIQLEAVKERILAYLDIIPGPSGEGWFAYVILTNLDCLERMYLDEVFHDIKIRNPRINRVFPEEDIRAISTFPFATCFPTIKEYEKFGQTIRQSENDYKVFTHHMEINKESCFVSVLRCSYLKHYLLLKIFKEKDIEKIYRKQFSSTVLIFILIMVMGLAFTRLITKNFIMPITDITNGVEAFSNKNYNYNIKVRTQNEFGIIADAFNQTALSLKNLEIDKITDKYFPLEKEFRCGSYLVHSDRVNTNLCSSDYFDYLPLKNGTYALISANISGNDSETIHLMSMLKTAFISLMPSYPNNPEIIMSKLDNLFEPFGKTRHIISCFIGILDPTNENIICTNAGQPFPILYDIKRKAGELCNLPSVSLGISFNSDKIYRKYSFNLRHKIFVLYSHRASDIINQNSENNIDNDFISIVNENLKNENANPASAILKSVNTESSHLPWNDDIYIVTIQNRI